MPIDEPGAFGLTGAPNTPSPLRLSGTGVVPPRLPLDAGSLGFIVLPPPKVGGEANPPPPGGEPGFTVLPLPKAGGAGKAPGGELGFTGLPLPKAGGAGNAPAGELGLTVLPPPKAGGAGNAPEGELGLTVLPLPKAGGAGNAPEGELGFTVLPPPKAGGAGNAPEGELGFTVLPLPNAGGEPNPPGLEGGPGVALGAGIPPGVGPVGPTVCAFATVASADAIAEARTRLESDLMWSFLGMKWREIAHPSVATRVPAARSAPAHRGLATLRRTFGEAERKLCGDGRLRRAAYRAHFAGVDPTRIYAGGLDQMFDDRVGAARGETLRLGLRQR